MVSATGKDKKPAILGYASSFYGKISHFVGRICDNSLSRSAAGLFTSSDVDIEDMGPENPEVVKRLLDQALQAKTLEKIDCDPESPAFRADIEKRVMIKNIKQKISFAIGSIPMFKLLEDIHFVKCLNPQAQIPLNFDLYFGISLPAFITLHIVEHILPVGKPRYFVQAAKVLTGLPFCVMAEGVDRVSAPILKVLKLPNTSLKMQGTIGVPSDMTLKEVLEQINSIPYYQELQKLYEKADVIGYKPLSDKNQKN